VEPKTRFFHTDAFWDHSMTIGRIAEHLSKKFATGMIEDEAYITGCLCNLGKLVLALVRPDVADRFHVEINDIHTLGPWTAAEQRHAGYQHTVIGEIGGALWGLSESSIDTIQGHHSVAHGGPFHLSQKDSELLADEMMPLAIQERAS
jgi:HD-like signal output (HDOD) protein